MNHTLNLLLLLTLALLSGCGETATSNVKAPKDTSKLIRAVADDATDWTWQVGTDGTQNGNNAGFTTYFMQGIPNEVKHFQYFLDTDNNANTGFSFGQDSWRISGADILVEDGAVYQSQSKTQWKWNYIGQLDDYTRSTVEGIEQINFNSNKNLLHITSDTVNVTIEPFDAAWGSTYSTISTQAVTLEKEHNNKNAQIFIIGDSTVHNNSRGEMGWGSALSSYMKRPSHAYNRARSGASSKTYKYNSQSKHDWNHTKALIEQKDLSAGAYLFIQFGHNDEKHGYTYTAPGRFNTYYNELKVYIDEARALGVTPVLVTPVSRQYKGSRTHGKYPQTMKELASDSHVLLLDLEYKSYLEFKKYASDQAIQNVFSYDDGTHFSPRGARIVAGWVKDLACSSNNQDLCHEFK